MPRRSSRALLFTLVVIACGAGGAAAAGCVGDEPTLVQSSDADAATPGETGSVDGRISERPPPGTLDTSFGDGGILVLPFTTGEEEAHCVVVGKNGIHIGGSIDTAQGKDFLVFRYRADGVLDPIWGDGGRAQMTIGPVRGVALMPDGRIVLVGRILTSAGNFDWALARVWP